MKNNIPIAIIIGAIIIGVFIFSGFLFTGGVIDDRKQTLEPITSFDDNGVVTKVIDGDTVIINGDSVRLLGIDADEKGYPCYNSAKIEKRVEIEEFIRVIQGYNREQIECTTHTFFRLSEKQRKIYTCDELRQILTKERPFLVGIQYNTNYAVFYKYNNRNLKIIVNLSNRKVKIVTFYFIEEWQIPKI